MKFMKRVANFGICEPPTSKVPKLHVPEEFHKFHIK